MKLVTKTIIIILAGSTMLAHGLRMMTQGLFFPQSIYPAPIPTSIDFWFDWFTLAVLGTIVFLIGIKSFYQQMQEKKMKTTVFVQPT
jgi:hypothetical protein